MGMLLSAELRLKRNVRMRHLATPPTPSAPSGPRKFAVSPRSQSRSTLPSLDVPRNLLNCVPQLVVDSSRDQRSVLMSPRKFAPDPEPTPELSRSQLLRNGVMFQLRNLVLLKMLQCSSISRTRLSLQLVL